MTVRRYAIPMTIAMLFVVLVAGCGDTKKTSEPTPSKPVELTISAAVSLKDALTEIQANYRKKVPHVSLALNLGGSGSLQKQIEQGAPADIFISAASKQMDELETKNLIRKDTRKNLAENTLVLIVPRDSKVVLSKFEDVASETVRRISVGEPTVVPAGQYAVQVLTKLGVWDMVKGKAVLAKDVRTVLTYVETGNVDAGIVYKTDAVNNAKVTIIATAPEGTHQPIIYPAAVLSGTKHQKAAEEFLAYMTSPDGKSVFEKFGFLLRK